MKKLLFISVAFFATFVLTSCQKDEPQINKQNVVGMWKLTSPDNASYVEYIDIRANGTFEMMLPSREDVVYYYCYSGEWLCTSDNLRFDATSELVYFDFNNITRIASLKKNVLLYKEYGVKSVSADSISLVRPTTNKHFSLVRISDKPAIWNNMYFAPDIEPTEDNMARKWDWLNKFNIDQQTGAFTWTAYGYPQYQGMKLGSDYHITNAYFFANYLYSYLDKKNALQGFSSVTIYPEFSVWSLNDNNSITLKCLKYKLSNLDANYNEIDSKEVIPIPTIEFKFYIALLNEYFMVLYGVSDDTYYTFTLGTEEQSAPNKVRSSSDSVTPYIHGESRHEDFFDVK